jgi:hypothetical protein
VTDPTPDHSETFIKATADERARRKFDQVGLITTPIGDVLIVRAGYRGRRHIVPPAGPDHAFEADAWQREVQISVSPMGRSVRVFVDGQEVPHAPRP